MLPQLVVEGRLTADPELRFAPSGVAVASFSVVCNDRKKNDAGTWEDVSPTFFRCTAFKTLAENVAESLRKGDLVIVSGKLKQDDYTNKEGEKRTSYQNIIVSMIGPSLAFATATVHKADRSGGGATTAAAPDPWATPAPGANLDEPPY